LLVSGAFEALSVMLDGIKRIIDSAKVQLLATAAFGAVFLVQ